MSEEVRVQFTSAREYLSQTPMTRKLIPMYGLFFVKSATSWQEIADTLRLSRRTVGYYLKLLEMLHMIRIENHGRNGIIVHIVNSTELKSAKNETKLADDNEIGIKSAKERVQLKSAKNRAKSKDTNNIGVKLKSAKFVDPELKSAKKVVKSAKINMLEVEKNLISGNTIDLDKTLDLDTKLDLDQNLSKTSVSLGKNLSKTSVDLDQNLFKTELDLDQDLYIKLKLPSSAKIVAEAKLEFPLKNYPAHVSAVWYWAVRRYELHGIDAVLGKDNFGKYAAMFSKTIPKVIGRTFDDLKGYIDWYLSSNDKFITDQVKWGINFLISESCVNKFLAERDSKPKKEFIANDEARRKIKGTWHRKDIQPP